MCVQFRSIEAISEGVEAPADKLLPEHQNVMRDEGGFADLDDDDLPF